MLNSSNQTALPVATRKGLTVPEKCRGQAILRSMLDLNPSVYVIIDRGDHQILEAGRGGPKEEVNMDRTIVSGGDIL